jgi:diguanylate cyclase (GGDEF)-like protein
MGILLFKSSEALASAFKKVLSVSEEVFTADVTADAKDLMLKHNITRIVVDNVTGDAGLKTALKSLKKLSKEYTAVLAVVKKEELKQIIISNPEIDDFMLKPFTFEEILLRLKQLDDIKKLHDSSSKSKKNLIKLSKEDPQTGLFNRRAILDEALREMNRSSRNLKFISAIMISITNYQYIGEKFGDEGKNRILTEFSMRIKRSCRPYDKIGRFGPSEFLILLPDSVTANAEKVSKRIIASTAVRNITINKEKMNLELAIGISDLDPDDVSKNNGVDDSLMNDLILDSFLRRTEMAMKKAQKKGINQAQVYHL